jgi:hypothetical protein
VAETAKLSFHQLPLTSHTAVVAVERLSALTQIALAQQADQVVAQSAIKLELRELRSGRRRNPAAQLAVTEIAVA